MLYNSSTMTILSAAARQLVALVTSTQQIIKICSFGTHGKDMRAVTTPVATPRAKEPLKTPRKMPKDLSSAMASKLWLLSPAGW